MEKLSERLVDKSIEAFIMGLEIYNKPTIKYRIEGFSFFICNAWELMLKARIIKTKGETEIYFKDKPNRTISLENTIEIIFPDKHGALRKNLLQIIELRNTSTHFITEDYEHLYAPLFQACVVHYIEKMKEFHNKDITEHIAQNFLTLSVRIDHLSEEEIRAKYSPEMAQRLLLEKKKITTAIEENNTNFAIPVETRFFITKNKHNADLIIGIDNNATTTANIIREIKNPNNLYPLRQKDVIQIVNRKLKSKSILLTKIKQGELIQAPLTTYDLQLVNQFYNIKKNEKFAFFYKHTNSYSYSQALCDFLVEEISKDPANFIKNLKKNIKK